MKKTLIFTLILTLMMSLFCVVPTIMADTHVTDNDHSVAASLQVQSLNSPVHEGINYYINIKAPEIFASYEDILAVKQQDDVIIKVKNNQIPPLQGAGHIEDNGERLELRNITIDRLTSKNGYIYLTYGGNLAHYKTIVHSYQTDSTTKDAIKEVGNFSAYLNSRNIVVTDDVRNILNTQIYDITYVEKETGAILYVATSHGEIYRINADGVTPIDIDDSSKALVAAAEGISVNEQEDVFIYGGSRGHEHDIYEKPMNKNVFDYVATYPNLIDIVARGSYVYILENDGLTMASKADIKTAVMDKFTMGNNAKNFIAFNLSTKDFVNYLSFAVEGSDNISTYKLAFYNDDPKLEFYNHYGANCTCETPHQGWYDSPTKVAMSSDEKTAYVVDRDGKRLVISTKDGDTRKYVQHFYNVDKLLLDKIDDVEVDKRNNLLIVNGDKIYIYTNNNDYKDDKTLPLRKIEELSGFDGDIIDIKVQNKMDSKIFVATANNSTYMITDSNRVPTKIASFDKSIVSIYPSYDATRLYVATKNNISSYPTSGADPTSPITSIDVVDANVTNIYVDYNGSVFASTDEALLRKYSRTGDTSYKYSNSFSSATPWQVLSDFFIIPSNKDIFFVDNSSHLVTKIDFAGWSKYYANENDKYIDANAYDQRLLYVAKTTNVCKVYENPTNYEIYRFAESGEYFYILAEDKENKNMYLVVDKDNNFVYINKTDLTRVEATTNSILGSTFMPLFGSVNVYMYPFENSVSKPITTINSTMTLVHNVAYDNGKVVWQNDTNKWFKVSYVNNQNIELTGYVKMNEITRSTIPTAPETKVHLRVTTKAGETATMYDAPDLASGIIAKGIVNGTLVRLAQDEFDVNSTFTYVQIEVDGTVKTGYMPTKNLMENKFTTLQIVAIIVSVLTVLITITIISLVLYLKKKKDNANTFKSSDEK